MKTEIIEQYIKFAVDNGYKFEEEKTILIRFYESQKYFIRNHEGFSKNYIELITSKPFIEAISRGVRNNEPEWEQDEMNTYKDYIERKFDEITTKQAKAIYDNKLEDFITNLGIGKN